MIAPPVGAAADGHAMSGVKVIMKDGYVRDGAGGAGLETDIVVAGVDIAVCDGDVARRAGIDSVSVAGGFGSHDFDTPCSEAVGLVDRDVEAGRVAQRDFVEDKVVDMAQ